MTTEASPRATYGALLRTPGVAPLYSLALTQILGTSLQIFALSVLVHRQTGSALWSSVAFGAGFLPYLLGGTLLTSLADRWPARTVIASGSVVRAAVMVLLALVELPPAAAIGLVGLVAVWAPLPAAAESAMLSRLLSGDLYVLGRSVFNLISSGAQLLGLATGGAVIAFLGPSAAFGVAAGLQVLGLLTIGLLPAEPARVARGRWRPGDTWRGNGDLLRDPTVRRILLSWWTVPVLLVGAEALVVAYVAESAGDAGSAGLLLAAFPGGAAVGDVIVGRWLSPRARQRAVPWLFAAVGVALLPLALHPSYAVTGACFAVASAAMAYQLGGQQAFVAALPDSRRGLGFGLFSTGLMGGQGLGPVVSGAVADQVGAGVTMTALGVAILVAAPVLGRLPQVGSAPRPG